MPFATVKSDPWKKGKTNRRKRFSLWSSVFWKKLVKQATVDRDVRLDPAPISQETIRMIGDMNELLYGTR